MAAADRGQGSRSRGPHRRRWMMPLPLPHPRSIWSGLGATLVLYCALMSNVLHEHRSTAGTFHELSALRRNSAENNSSSSHSNNPHPSHPERAVDALRSEGGGGEPLAPPADADAPAAAVFADAFRSAPGCRSLRPDDVNFTLVTQLSAGRLWMMEHHCERWGADNPVSLAVHGTRPQKDTPLFVRARLLALGCRNVAVHVLVDDPNSSSNNNNATSTARYRPRHYPINALRNLAFQSVATTHAVYADVDFWPSRTLHGHLMQQHVREHLARDDRAAIVVPAFGYSGRCPRKECRHRVPGNYSHLLSLLNRKTRPKVNQFAHWYDAAHGTTDYRTWAEVQTARDLIEIPCVKSNRYEPYLAVRWCDKLPPFQEAFTGYGKNKITWILQLRRSGYTMHQLGEAFLVHYPHKASDARVAWDGGRNKPAANAGGANASDAAAADLHRFETDRIFVQFKEWLAEHVPDQARLPACETAEQDDAVLWTQQREGQSGTKKKKKTKKKMMKAEVEAEAVSS